LQNRFKEKISEAVIALNQEAGSRFNGATLNSFDFSRDSALTEKVEKYVDGFWKERNGLFLWGKFGVGKTHLAIALAKQILVSASPETRIPRVKFYSIVSAMNSIKESIRQDTYSDAVDALKNPFLLVLDDLGKQKMTEWAGETLFEIINFRYNWLKPTIYTSNLPLPDLFSDMGGGVISRIKGSCKVIEIKGKDYRLNA